MSDLVSQLNAIKDKLEQYSKSNNDAKVNEYLDKLGTVQMTIDLLKVVNRFLNSSFFYIHFILHRKQN